MANAIEIQALRKSFGRTAALDGLDLEVRAGEVHAFLGPNGAGKTTTLRILLGLLRTDGGHATLLGGDPWRDAVALHRPARWPGARRPAAVAVRRRAGAVRRRPGRPAPPRHRVSFANPEFGDRTLHTVADKLLMYPGEGRSAG
jgi:energy-coupling factor transporter ATP-binding protein EcfA2